MHACMPAVMLACSMQACVQASTNAKYMHARMQACNCRHDNVRVHPAHSPAARKMHGRSMWPTQVSSSKEGLRTTLPVHVGSHEKQVTNEPSMKERASLSSQTKVRRKTWMLSWTLPNTHNCFLRSLTSLTPWRKYWSNECDVHLIDSGNVTLLAKQNKPDS